MTSVKDRPGPRAEGGALAGVAAVVLISWIGFFNRYAFDDSYIGYTIARSLASGQGFVFNAGVRFLSTSAPLAVPLYALLSRVSGQSIVLVAQVLSAVAMGVIGFGSYALVRRYASIFGAFAAATIMVSSPFTLPLWSHETLLYAATTIAGLVLYARGATAGAAIVLGLATLFRGEALVVLPFLWVVHYRRYGMRQALRFAASSLAPYACWCAFAAFYFGGFLSETVASKQAQLHYDGIVPYITGLGLYVVVMFGFGGTFWGLLAVYFTVGSGVAGAGLGSFRPAYRGVLLWALATTTLYLLLRMPFYGWFTLQFGVVMALCAAVMWPREPPPKRKVLVAVGRCCAIGLLSLNVAFLASNVLHPEQRLTYNGLWGVMSSIHDNAYRKLGEWFSQHAAPRETLSFVEFGQLRYYSGRNIVDYLGIATPGAATRLRDGDPIWTFKQFKPTWIVDSPTWHWFVTPLEYDWLRAAYERRTTFDFPGEELRRKFEVYRLRPNAEIPLADDKDDTIVVHAMGSPGAAALDLTFDTTRAGMSEVEARVHLNAECPRLQMRLTSHGAPIAVRDERVPAGVSRVTLAFPPRHAATAYSLRLEGCPLTLAPPLPLRRGFLALTLGATGTPRLEDALVVYRR